MSYGTNRQYFKIICDIIYYNKTIRCFIMNVPKEKIMNNENKEIRKCEK